MLYKTHFVFTLEHILEYVKSQYPKYKRDLFDNFFVYKALDELIQRNDNDFNNLRDYIFDKFNRPGYIIHRGIYYIFQMFNESERIPMYHRKNYIGASEIVHNMSLNKYLEIQGITLVDDNDAAWQYDFNSTIE